ELDLDLLFDVTLAGGSVAADDVRDLTRPLWNLAENAGPESAGGPQVRFVWGKSWNVPGVVGSGAGRLEDVAPEGVGRRSWRRPPLWRGAGEGRGGLARGPLPGPPVDVAAVAALPPESFSLRELGGGLGPGGGERLDTFLARNRIPPAQWKAVAAL